MTRKADEANRSQLLDRIVAYVLANGVASLSLRPLAKEIGVSPASLLYHFHSKDELTIAILKHAGDQQRALFANLLVTGDTPADAVRAIWGVISAPEARGLFGLFFEVYGIALLDRKRFPGFFPNAVENWLDFLERNCVSCDLSPDEARARATLLLGVFRGFLLDLCATGDEARLARAVDVWLEVLQQ